MNWTLELQGSEVQWAKLSSGQLCLHLSAAAVRRGHGSEAEDGHVKGLALRFSAVTLIEGDPADCMGALSDSIVHIQGVRHRHLALPCDATGDVRAEFLFRSGSSLVLRATALQCLPPAGARFLPSYAC
jgi:hypothetical protein